MTAIGRSAAWQRLARVVGRTLACLAPLGLLAPGGLQAAAPGDAVRGKAAFAVCASCHQVGPSARNGFGPPLNGVVGRAAGTAAGYNYSAAMKNAGVVWTAPTLAAFIQSPDQVVPGTKMRFSGFGYSETRLADLVAYLGSLQTAAPASEPSARPSR